MNRAELVSRVSRLLASIPDQQLAAETIVDVCLSRAHAHGGGRPRQAGPAQSYGTAATLPGVDVNNPESEASKPQETGLQTSNSSMSGSESGSDSLSLFSDPPTENLSGDRRRNEPPPPPGFGDFWALYPRRVGKDDALKAWAKHKPPIAKVRAALLWQIQAWDDESPPRPIEKIPHPTTWLNGRRWNDEPPPPRQKTPDARAAAFSRAVKGDF